jgi:hypothetical protein
MCVATPLRPEDSHRAATAATTSRHAWGTTVQLSNGRHRQRGDIPREPEQNEQRRKDHDRLRHNRDLPVGNEPETNASIGAREKTARQASRNLATLLLASAAAVLALLNQQPGVELILSRNAATRTFDLPADRVGDIVVIGDRGTTLGKSKATLDLSELGGISLRSHGGLSERNVYLMFSRPLSDEYANIALSRQLRNFDVFDFVLNGLR